MESYCEGVKRQMSKSAIRTLLVTYLVISIVSAALAAPETSAGASSRMDEQDEDKRAAAKQYSFGIGKKSDGAWDDAQYYEEALEPSYGYDDGKRADPARFGFGIGKRVRDGQMRYSPFKKAANRFAFGLGKRYFGNPSEQDEFNKRRYSFGIGKRGQRYEFGLGR